MSDQITTTLTEFWNTFYTHMLELIGTGAGSGGLTIQAVAEGESTFDQFPIPFVIIQLLDFKVTDRVGVNKVWEGQIKIRVVTRQTPAVRPAVEIMEKIEDIQEKVDVFVRPEGSRGLEDANWSITYSLTPGAGNLIVAEQLANFQVNIARG